MDPTGTVFTADEWDDVRSYVRRDDHRFTVAIPELLEELAALTDDSESRDDDFPLVLGRRAPLVHGQHDLPRPGLAPARS